MDHKQPFDRSLLIPILIGLCSVLGICLVLFAARLNTQRVNLPGMETGTPLKYQYLATEPGVVFPTVASPTVSVSDTPILTDTFLPPTSTITIVVETLVNRPNATNTFTPSPIPVLLNVTYDDANSIFNYAGNWVPRNDVTDVYQKTLHVSNSIGDSVLFSFVGQKIRLTYQAGPSLGTVALVLDDVSFALAQLAADTQPGEWESPVLALTSHTLTITHISGGSINLDSIAVLDLSTPTPTSTPTATVTP